MPTLSNTLHFFTLTKPFTYQEEICIIEWANPNPHFTVTIWAPAALTHQIATSLKGRAEMSSSHEEVLLHQTGPDQFRIMWWYFEDRILLYVHSYDRLNKLMEDEAMLHELANHYNREHTAQTFGGLTIIHNVGGIFINRCVKPSPLPLPPSINAPRGVLFASAPESPDKLSGYVIAGQQGSEKIEQLAKIYQTGYNSIFANSSGRLVGDPQRDADIRRKREELADYERYSLLDDSDEIITALQAARQAYRETVSFDPYDPLRDSEYIEGWINLRERLTSAAYSIIGASPEDKYARPARSILKRKADDPRFNFPHIIPPPPKNYHEYSFQQQTGILIRVFSD